MLQEHVVQNKGGSKYIFHYKQLDSPYLMVEKLAVPSIKQLVYQTSDTCQWEFRCSFQTIHKHRKTFSHSSRPCKFCWQVSYRYIDHRVVQDFELFDLE